MLTSMLRVMMVASFAAAAGPALADTEYSEERNAQGLRDCDCRAQGVLWRQGQELCIAGQLQICAMDQNVSSWRSTGRTCPTALAPAFSTRKSRRDG